MRLKINLFAAALAAVMVVVSVPATTFAKTTAPKYTISKDGYDLIREYGDGLIPVKRFGKWGFADAGGNLKINYKFINARKFSQGFAAVQDENNLWGIINKNGDYVLQPKYLDAKFFTEGVIPVKSPANGKWGFITFDRYDAKYFNAGVMPDPAGIVADWGFIVNNSDRVNDIFESQVSPFDFDELDVLWQGRAAARKGAWGFIDKFGRTLINFTYAQADTVAPLNDSDSRWQQTYNEYLDANGNFTSLFKEGFARVSTGAGYSFINGNGVTMYAGMNYEDVRPFNNSLAAVKTGGVWGYIDLSGAYVIWPTYVGAESFNDGYAIVSKYDPQQNLNVSFFIDRVNRPVYISGFDVKGITLGSQPGISKQTIVADMIPAKNLFSGSYGFANMSGNIVISDKFYSTSNYGANALAPAATWVNGAVKYGLIDKKGAWYVPAVFDEIYWQSPKDNIYYVKNTGKYFVMSVKGVTVKTTDNYTSSPYGEDKRTTDANSLIPTIPKADPPRTKSSKPVTGFSTDVQRIQKALTEKGFYTGATDGLMGPATTNAVKAFQKANNLTADGIVGPVTRKALGI